MDNTKCPVKECPHCGGKILVVKQSISGFGVYYVDMETGRIDTSDLHLGLQYRNTGKYATCADCGKRVLKIDDLDVVD